MAAADRTPADRSQVYLSYRLLRRKADLPRAPPAGAAARPRLV